MSLPEAYSLRDYFTEPALSGCWQQESTPGREPYTSPTGLQMPGGTGGAQSGIGTVDHWDLRGSAVEIQFPVLAGTQAIGLVLDVYAAPTYQITLGARLDLGYYDCSVLYAPYSFATPPYDGGTRVRIRETAGTLYLETFKDGLWTTRIARAALPGLGEVDVHLGAATVAVTCTSYNGGGVPSCPAAPQPQPGLAVEQTYAFRDAKGHVGVARAWIDPANAENGRDLAAVAARLQELGTRLDYASRAFWESAHGPFDREAFLGYGSALDGAEVGDVLGLTAQTDSHALATLDIPACRWSEADLALVADLADAQVAAVADYWAAHCCDRYGSPIRAIIGGERRYTGIRRRMGLPQRSPALYPRQSLVETATGATLVETATGATLIGT